MIRILPSLPYPTRDRFGPKTSPFPVLWDRHFGGGSPPHGDPLPQSGYSPNQLHSKVSGRFGRCDFGDG